MGVEQLDASCLDEPTNGERHRHIERVPDELAQALLQDQHLAGGQLQIGEHLPCAIDADEMRVMTQPLQ